MPTISIITPTYRRKEMIERAILSVLKQTYTDWEMIIVDDCPDDPAEDVVRNYTASDTRISYFKHKKNLGGGSARNTGMEKATGNYFCFIDDDDVWYPDALQVMYNGIKNTPAEVGYCFAAIEIEYPDGSARSVAVPEGVADYHELVIRNFSGFTGQRLIVKREVFEKVGGWAPELPSHQEIEWVFRISKKYLGVGVNIPIIRFFPGDGHAHIGNDFSRRIKGREIFLEHYHAEFMKYPYYYSRHLFLLAMWYRETGDYIHAREVLRRALSIHFSVRHITHYMLLMWGGAGYKLLMHARILRKFGEL